MLVNSIFSFFLNVFKTLPPQGRSRSGFSGKRLICGLPMILFLIILNHYPEVKTYISIHDNYPPNSNNWHKAEYYYMLIIYNLEVKKICRKKKNVAKKEPVQHRSYCKEAKGEPLKHQSCCLQTTFTQGCACSTGISLATNW